MHNEFQLRIKAKKKGILELDVILKTTNWFVKRIGVVSAARAEDQVEQDRRQRPRAEAESRCN